MESDAAGAIAALMVPLIVVGFLLAVFFVVCGWKVFAKAGQPGWAVLIPFYNLYVWLKVAGRPGWWMIPWIVLSFIPILNFATLILGVIVTIDICKAFGKSAGFMVLMIFLPFIGLPILAFGSATYTKPVRA